MTAPEGFVFIKDSIKIGCRSCNGSENRCDVQWADYVEIIPGTGIKLPRTVKTRAYARGPKGHFSGRGWSKYTVVVKYTKYQTGALASAQPVFSTVADSIVSASEVSAGTAQSVLSLASSQDAGDAAEPIGESDCCDGQAEGLLAKIEQLAAELEDIRDQLGNNSSMLQLSSVEDLGESERAGSSEMVDNAAFGRTSIRASLDLDARQRGDSVAVKVCGRIKVKVFGRTVANASECKSVRIGLDGGETTINSGPLRIRVYVDGGKVCAEGQVCVSRWCRGVKTCAEIN